MISELITGQRGRQKGVYDLASLTGLTMAPFRVPKQQDQANLIEVGSPTIDVLTSEDYMEPA